MEDWKYHISLALSEGVSDAVLSKIYDVVEAEIARTSGCTCEYYWHNQQDHDAKCPVSIRFQPPSVELTFQNESVCGYGDPFVAVMVNGVQHDKVWAYIDREQGADGGWYSAVKFRRS